MMRFILNEGAQKRRGVDMTKDSGDILQNHENRITRLEVINENINSTLLRIEKRMDFLDQDMKQGFKDINNRLWTNFFWSIGGFIGILGILAHGFHWL